MDTYPNSTDDVHSSNDLFIGLTLAIISSAFIGVSFIVTKKGLLRVEASSRAGRGGYAYLKEWLWWLGLLLMGVGEAANFAAFGFVPIGFVTSLGVLSVLISAVLSSFLLNERLGDHAKMGIFWIVVSSGLTVTYLPESTQVMDLHQMANNMLSIGFIIYTTIALSLVLYLVFWVAPRYGQTNVLVYPCTCSTLGSLSVVFAKGLSIAIRLTLSGDSQIGNPFSWFCLFAMVTGIAVQLTHLNKALDTFNTVLVMSIYYVMFPTLTITSSSILFKEWAMLSAEKVAVNMIEKLYGFGVFYCGVFFLLVHKDVDASLSDLLLSDYKKRLKLEEGVLH